ncbi:MAG: hypothetical protein IPO81_04255 [Kouleothrix sp.]|nr:hypothetical protein [Kouleothrix sp.]
MHGYGSSEHDLFGLAPYLDPRFLVVSARAPYHADAGRLRLVRAGLDGHRHHDRLPAG